MELLSSLNTDNDDDYDVQLDLKAGVKTSSISPTLCAKTLMMKGGERLLGHDRLFEWIWYVPNKAVSSAAPGWELVLYQDSHRCSP